MWHQVIQRPAPGKASVGRMPVAYVLFTKLPAQADLFGAAAPRKIDEAGFEIFHLPALFLHTPQAFHHYLVIPSEHGLAVADRR